MISQSIDLEEVPSRTIPDVPLWSENYALMGSDPTSRSALFFGTGRWHGDLTMWRELLLVALPDERIIFAKGFGRNGTDRGPGGAFAHLEVIEPGRTLRLTYDGPVWQGHFDELFDHGFRDGSAQPCKVDLLFEATVPMWNMDGSSTGATEVAGASHIDQIGKVNGTVTYDGTTFPFNDGYSIRDHSRGPRNLSRYKAHCWTSGHFPGSDTAYYVYAVQLQGTDRFGMLNAAIVDGGKLYPATVVDIDMPRSAEDVKMLVRLTLRSALGDKRIEVKELLNRVVTGTVFPYDTVIGGRVDQNSAVIVDGPTRIICDGEDGFGWSEIGYTPEAL